MTTCPALRVLFCTDAFSPVCIGALQKLLTDELHHLQPLDALAVVANPKDREKYAKERVTILVRDDPNGWIVQLFLRTYREMPEAGTPVRFFMVAGDDRASLTFSQLTSGRKTE